jgi:hypothetical protein
VATRRTRTPARSQARRRLKATARSVRTAAERAVERVLSSEEAFALLIDRLEAAGWHVERESGATPARLENESAGLTPPARAR